jgi:hypothetical protein
VKTSLWSRRCCHWRRTAGSPVRYATSSRSWDGTHSQFADWAWLLWILTGLWVEGRLWVSCFFFFFFFIRLWVFCFIMDRPWVSWFCFVEQTSSLLFYSGQTLSLLFFSNQTLSLY